MDQMMKDHLDATTQEVLARAQDSALALEVSARKMDRQRETGAHGRADPRRRLAQTGTNRATGKEALSDKRTESAT
jgi:hypothetical protein